MPYHFVSKAYCIVSDLVFLLVLFLCFVFGLLVYRPAEVTAEMILSEINTEEVC